MKNQSHNESKELKLTKIFDENSNYDDTKS